jgi:hypothetical protein
VVGFPSMTGTVPKRNAGNPYLNLILKSVILVKRSVAELRGRGKKNQWALTLPQYEYFKFAPV